MAGIAIVGMGCRFPGDVRDAASYWAALCDGRCGISDIPDDRWSLDGFYDPKPDVPGRSYSKWGGFLADIDRFDASFFGFNAREAEALDPQQRLLLQTAYEAAQDAGLPLSHLRQATTGVFVGLSNTDYGHLQRTRFAGSDIQAGTGTALSIVANRVSNTFDLSGPSMGIDTACSSSLVALDTACRHLDDGSCDIAIVAGVNIILDPRLFATFSQAHMLSPTGRIKAFDADADGFVRGEGVGVAVLMAERNAAAANARIYAVIETTAVNQDGGTGTITAPNIDAQRRMLERVAQQGGVEKDDLVYAEAHGTGTVVGDPIEANAIGQVFGGADRCEPLYIGSSKPNIGHLEPAAGIAGLIKTALILHHRVIPPSIGYENPNPRIDFAGHNLAVATACQALPATPAVPRAIVNSFGFGGTNACALLRQAPSNECAERRPSIGPAQRACDNANAIAMPISAPTQEHLRAYAGQLSTWLGTGAAAGLPISRVAAALATRRDHFDHRAVVIAHSTDDLVAKLDCLADGRPWPKAERYDPPGIVRGEARHGRKLAFTMTGQGGQWWSMGRDLLLYHPVFRETVLEFDAVFKSAAGWSVVDVLMADEAESPIDDAAITPAVMFAFQTGLAAFWKSIGVAPDIVVGHSFGEVTAAYLAGGLSQAEVARLVNQRGLIRGAVNRHGNMAAIGLGAREVARYLPGDGSIEIGGYNAPRLVTLTGDEAAIDRLITAVHADDNTILARKLALDFAYHSSWFEPVEGHFKAAVGELATAPPQIPVISTVTGELNDQFDADYWWRNLRYPVRYQAAIETALDAGADTFVELGPHRTLSSMTAGCATEQGRDVVTISTLYRQWNDFVSLATAVGELYVAGINVDWDALHGSPDVSRVDLPKQPWIDSRHWIEPEEAKNQLRPEQRHPLLGTRDLAPGHQWSNEVSLAEHRYLADHVVADSIVFPATAYLEMMYAAARVALAGDEIELLDVEFVEALRFDGGEDVQLKTVFRDDRRRIEIHSRVRGQGPDWTLRCRATAVARDVLWSPLGDEVTGDTLDATEFYARASMAGYGYGGAFRCLDTITVGPHTAGARASLVDERGDGVAPMRLDPRLLDACLQLLIPCAHAGGAGARYELMLPVAIARVMIRSGLTDTVAARATRSGEAFTVEISSRDADPIVRLEGIRTRAARPSAALLDEATGSGRFFLEKFVPLQLPTKDRPARSPALIFAREDDDTAGRLRCAYEAVRGDVHVVPVLRDREVRAADFACAIDAWLAERPAGEIVYALALPGGPSDPTTAFADAAATQTKRIIAFGQALSKREERLAGIPIVVLTHLARPDGDADSAEKAIAQSMIAPVARTIALECPKLDLRTVDCDCDDADSLETVARMNHGETRETELVVRAGAVTVPRLHECQARDLRARTTPASSTDRDFALHHASQRSQNAFAWRRTGPPQRRQDTVCIDVLAAGLNFRDVMATNGMLPVDAEKDDARAHLGLEFSGVVARDQAGSSTFAPGQRVFGFARGALRGRVWCDPHLVFETPDALSDDQAATLSSAYLTAYRALVDLARLEPDEWVLVHSGAGGLGLAAVHIARSRGARIIATAGNDEKRMYLTDLGVDVVLPSRTLDFADAVLAATDGRGVDVVLNALPGDFITLGLRCLAPYGRFIEVGKRDVYADAPIGLRAMRRNVSFHVVDVAALIDDRPRLVRRAMDAILELVRSGKVPALPVTAFPASRVEDAFRYFASGRHVGRIAVHLSDPDLMVEQQQDVRLDERRSVLITGGSSRIGQALALQFARIGAGRVVLASRQRLDREVLARLQKQAATFACEIDTVALDVTDQVMVDAVVGDLAASDLPPCGIVHAAVAYHDALLGDMSADKIDAVLAPKLDGAVNLTKAVLAHDCRLAFFVSFSSMAQVVGWPGQSNYVAANALLEALAHWQRHQGVPGQCINWGVFAQSGQVARDDRLASYMTHSGWHGLDDDAICTRVLDVIASGEVAVSVGDADWRQIAQAHKSIAKAARLSELIGAAPEASSRLDVRQLGQMDQHARCQRLQELLRHHVARVVGADATLAGSCETLNDAGIDSLSMFELRVHLERAFGLEVPVARFVEATTFADLATLFSGLIEAAAGRPEVSERAERDRVSARP